MITHPTVLKYDVDADRLVELYRQRRAEIEARPHPRRRSAHSPVLWLVHRVFAGRRTGAAAAPGTALPDRS